MKKILMNILSAFVPSKALRHRLRKQVQPKRPTESEHAVFSLDASTSQQKMASLIYRCSASSVLHPKTFGEYKGFLAGREAVLVAAGPTAENYLPIKDAVHVGCNRSFMLDSVLLDFLFLADFRGISSFVQDFIDYKGNDCVKFVTDLMGSPSQQIPESFFLKLRNARKYKTDFGCGDWRGIIPVDIDLHPIWNSSTIAHHAFQFLLFTNPQKIYLVGCDCTGHLAGHCVNGGNDKMISKSLSPQQWDFATDVMIAGWHKLKDFASIYYPDTEIISINPVGLKGVFRDVFI